MERKNFSFLAAAIQEKKWKIKEKAINFQSVNIVQLV